MANRAIGIFDSGVGGLTVAKAVRELLPNEDIVYFGDTVHLPYGNKTNRAIVKYSHQNVEFLISKGVKIIVVACNTASSVALEVLKETYKIPIINVLEPGCEHAEKKTNVNKIGVIGTFRTVSTKAYSKYLLKLNNNLKIYEKACPLFVPLIEENFPNQTIKDMIIREYLVELVEKGIDSLILGCTHYPMIKEQIQKLFKKIIIIDSAQATADKIKFVLENNNLYNNKKALGSTKIYVNDKSEVFDSITKKLFPNISPKQLIIEGY